MNNLKTKLKAIWMILKADGFDVAVTYWKKNRCLLWTASVFGKDAKANIIHNDIGDRFAHWYAKIDKCKKT